MVRACRTWPIRRRSRGLPPGSPRMPVPGYSAGIASCGSCRRAGCGVVGPIFLAFWRDIPASVLGQFFSLFFDFCTVGAVFGLLATDRVPGEIKRSRDLRGGRWSWTLKFAQKRSWVGRWRWAEQAGRLLLRVVQVVCQQQCNGHCLSDSVQHSSWNSNCAVHKSLGNGEGHRLTLPLFWRRSTVSPVFFGRFPWSNLCHCPSRCVCYNNYLTLPKNDLGNPYFSLLLYCILLYTVSSSVNWLAVSCTLPRHCEIWVLSASQAHNLCAWLLIILSCIIVTYR